MAEFLTGGKLGKKVREICTGKNVRCIVAFWGNGAKDELFGDADVSMIKIICDLSMGATNPEELRLLGAPEAKHIRHLCHLHAKMYLSDEGVVVTSANASGNGLGAGGKNAAHIEVGVFHKRKSSVFEGCEKWFEDMWKDADKITEEDLVAAKKAWGKKRLPREVTFPNVEPKTFFNLIKEEPDVFSAYKFSFSEGRLDESTIEEAKKKIKRKGNLDDAEVDRLEKNAMSEGSEPCPEQFINLHLEENKVSIDAYAKGECANGVMFPRKIHWNTVKKISGCSENKEKTEETADKYRENRKWNEWWKNEPREYLSAREFSEKLREIDS